MRKALNKINPIAFVLIYALTFVYIIYKVLHVPITHDEVATTLNYSNFSVWEIMMYPDPWPNNHILNTLSTKFCLFLFGGESWAVRLPNLFSFVIFAIGAHRIIKAILPKDSLFFIPAALLFVASPYVLDFFGLCRGYGMSVALCTLSVSYIITGFSNSNQKNIWLGLVLSILACYANFTLLVFWAAITVLGWFYFYSSYRTKKTNLLRPTLMLFITSVAYLALIAPPLYKMQSTEQFEFWTSKGFYNETMLPLIQNSKYDSKIFITAEFIAWFSIVLLLLNSVYVFVQFKKSKYNLEVLSRPLSIATLIILLTTGINLLQVWLLDTPNLNGRTALFFYLLFVVALISSYEYMKKIKFASVKIMISVLMALMLSHHVIHTMKPNSVREWSYDANTLKVIEYIQKDGVDLKSSVTLATDWMFNPSFSFYSYTGKTPWLQLTNESYNYEINPENGAAYFYVFAEDYPILESKYEPVIQFENNCWLLKLR